MGFDWLMLHQFVFIFCPLDHFLRVCRYFKPLCGDFDAVFGCFVCLFLFVGILCQFVHTEADILTLCVFPTRQRLR